LLAKRNPVIEAARAHDRAAAEQKGIARGQAESLIAVLDARRVALGSADRARILGERDPAILARWIMRAATCTEVAELFIEV
jgi:hypothetical protein